jgi:sugar-specific transcriptional regulator TrmB
MITSKLIELGFSEEEAKIYLALLELGGSYVSNIARRTKIPRANCYYILNELKNNGIVSEVEKKKLKFYTSMSPEMLFKKEKSNLEKLESLIPELLAIENTQTIKPKIKYFEGLDGIQQIYEDTLEEKGEIVGYSNLELVTTTLNHYMERYAKRKIASKIRSRIIAPGTKESKTFLEHYYSSDPLRKITEILFVSPQSFLFENDIFIYGKKLAIISLQKEELFGMILESGSVARTQRSLFNLAWLGATSFVVT